jgi:hypothetical protein
MDISQIGFIRDSSQILVFRVGATQSFKTQDFLWTFAVTNPLLSDLFIST